MTTGREEGTGDTSYATATSAEMTGSRSGISRDADPKQKASEIISQAQEQTSQTVGQAAEKAQETAKSKIAVGKDQAAEQVGVVAQALHQTGEQLQQQEIVAIGDYAAKAADKLDQLSDHLRQSDVSQLVRETEDLARREPTLFLGGAFALGVLAARFLKSSAQQHYNASNRSYSSAHNSGYVSVGDGASNYGEAYSSANRYASSTDTAPSTAGVASSVGTAGVTSGTAVSTSDGTEEV